MNSKRSMWKLFVGVAGVGLLVTNCTIKTASDADTAGASNSNAGAGNPSAGAGNSTSGECSPVGKKLSGCICAGNLVSYQVCTEEGIYGDCVCATGEGGASYGGAGNSSAGKGGSWTAGGASGAAAGEGGEGGEGPTVFATCEDCLDARCSKQYAACDADPACISADVDGSGQYERIAKCINQERVKGLVKRDVVRGCGVTMGASPDPDFSVWAPDGMAATTTALLNCMADAPGAQAASWANDDANYPVDANDDIHPTPWPAGTCAKDACTSAL